MLYDSDSKFALSTQGPVPGEGLGQFNIDPDSYRHVLAAFSRGVFDAKRQQRLVRREQLHDVDARPLPRARRPRPLHGDATTTSTASPTTPGPVATWCSGHAPATATPRGWSAPNGHRPASARPPAPGSRRRRRWRCRSRSRDGSPAPARPSRRGSSLDGAEALATYEHPHLGRWAAVTTRPVGAGRITVVGTVPDQELAAALVRWLAPSPVGGWTTDASVTVASSSTAAGRLHVVHNWGWAPAAATPATDVTDLLTGEATGAARACPSGRGTSASSPARPGPAAPAT